jgi:hypothetical protein
MFAKSFAAEKKLGKKVLPKEIRTPYSADLKPNEGGAPCVGYIQF